MNIRKEFSSLTGLTTVYVEHDGLVGVGVSAIVHLGGSEDQAIGRALIGLAGAFFQRHLQVVSKAKGGE